MVERHGHERLVIGGQIKGQDAAEVLVDQRGVGHHRALGPRGGTRGVQQLGEVVAGAREYLAPFKVPKRVVFVDELPRNQSGKLLKRELRQG